MFLSTFQGKFDFQGLFKTVLYIQVLFKSVQTLYNDVITSRVENDVDPDQKALLEAS